jgi:ADP-ribose pyrophosphatase YjhB (NUDIX family)
VVIDEREFFEELTKKQRIRVSIRSLCFYNGKILLEKAINEEGEANYYSFIGGELEFGEVMDDRLIKEYQEETNVEVISLKYLFCVENHFYYNNQLIHSLEHYYSVKISSDEVKSREPYIKQVWLPLDELEKYDIRPKVVKEAILTNTWKKRKHFKNIEVT